MKRLYPLLLGLALSAGAQAGVLSYSFTSDETPTDFNVSGPLGLFDSSLGTLTGVTLELYGEVATSLRIANTGKGPMSRARASVDIDMFFGSSLAALDELLSQDGAPWMSWSVDTGLLRLAAGASKTFDPVTDGIVADIDASSLLPSFMAAGGGDFDISCRSRTFTMVTMSGGNGQFSQNTTGACAATITYTYSDPLPPVQMADGFGGGVAADGGLSSGGGAADDGLSGGGLSSGTGSTPRAVPEPPSLALVGLALAGMAFRGRRGGKRRAA